MLTLKGKDWYVKFIPTKLLHYMMRISDNLVNSKLQDKYHKCCIKSGTNFTRQGQVKFVISRVLNFTVPTYAIQS